MRRKGKQVKRWAAFLMTMLLVFTSLSWTPFTESAEAKTSDDAVAVISSDTASYIYLSETVTYSSYSWSSSATSGYYEMAGYYQDSNGSYQVYYQYSSTGSDDDEVVTISLYYTTDSGSSYTSLETLTSSGSGSVSLYKAYLTFSVTYDELYSAIDKTSSDFEILRGYYYYKNSTLYYVYYIYDSDSGSITLYYSGSANLTESGDAAGTIVTLTSSSSTTVTLYTEFELNISAYKKSALVYWDVDDAEGDVSETEDKQMISSVTLSNTNTEAANSVAWAESTESGDAVSWSGGLALSSVYVDSTGTAVSNATLASEESTLTITPATGYYVSEIIISCAPAVPTGSTDNDDDGDDGEDNGGGDNNGGGNGNEGGGDINGGGNGNEGGGGTGGGGTGGFGVSTASEDEVTADSDAEEAASGDASTAAETASSDKEDAAANEDEEEESSETEDDDVSAAADDVETTASSYTRVSPYKCSTYVTGQSYSETFTLDESEASDSGYTLSVDVSNLYFSHTGALASDETQIYFILIKVAPIPSPAYVEYDYGDIADYISTYNTENSLTSTDEDYVSDTIFTSSASGWTSTAATGNVYYDSGSSESTTAASTSTTGSTLVSGGQGGVLTDYTQYEYVHSGTYSGQWKHYANSITSDAVNTAAKAGYVFAGWAVTWYADATPSASSEGSYNSCTISFSSKTATSWRAAGDEVQVSGHVRLVAQWVKADDLTQVIDYGLPVSLDVVEELDDSLTLKVITSDVSSRTSSTTSYEDATTEKLNTTATISYIVESTSDDDSTDSGGTDSGDDDETASADENNDGNTGDDSSGSTESETATEEYGTFSLSSNGDAVYTLSDELTGIESVDYQVTVSYVSSSGTATVAAEPTGTLSIIPATSMYYEDDFGATIGTYTYSSGSVENTVTTNGVLITYSMGGAFWVQESGDASSATTQESGVVGTTTDSTYGADTYYYSNLGDSDNTSMYVDTSNYAASFSYSFTGTGTAIYGRTLKDEGAYITVTIYDSSNKAVGWWGIDTRIVDNVSGSTELYNIPIFSETGLDYGTYTVSVLVYKEGAPVEPTYTTSSTNSRNETLTKVSEIETDDDGNSTITYWYYVYDSSGNQMYYAEDSSGNETSEMTTEVTDYPVYYSDTTGTSTTATIDSTSYTVSVLYYLADDTSGDDFYLDGIRIYNPLGTESEEADEDGEDTDDDSGDDTGSDETVTAAEDTETEDGSTESASGDASDYEIASAAYAEDDESNNVVINIAQKLAADYEEGYSKNDTCFTLTDYYGDIESYNSSDVEDYPDNEIYLDTSTTSTDDSSGKTYSVSFYLAASDISQYDFYLGLKAPDGTAGSVKINDAEVTVSGSADCYYKLDDYLTSSTSIGVESDDGTESTVTAYKVTVTGNSGLIALTYIKVTGNDEFDIAYSTDTTAENEYTNSSVSAASEGTVAVSALADNTVYILSAAAYGSVDDDSDTDDDTDDGSDGDSENDSDPQDDEDDTEPEDQDDGDLNDGDQDDEDSEEENGTTVFTPEKFTASITYLKLLKYVTISINVSSDVSYVSVNGEVVNAKNLFGKTYYSYSASKVSSGTTYEIIAYDADGVSSESITLIAK